MESAPESPVDRPLESLQEGQGDQRREPEGGAPFGASLDEKLQVLGARLSELGSVLVCFSGGTDSAFVLAMAHRVLGAKAVGMTAVSPSLAPAEKVAAVEFATSLGADHRLVESREMEDPNYVANGTRRCYFCKTELYRLAHEKRLEWGLAAVLNGANLDDFGDYRPGLQAAEQAGALSPLVEAGFRKQDVRDAAQRMGLAVWDKPASACLASRVPYGTAVTGEILGRIADFEAALKRLGFGQVRVRYHGAVARIEVELEALVRAVGGDLRTQVIEAGRDAGFRYVTLDLGGYRPGSHNEVIDALPVSATAPDAL